MGGCNFCANPSHSAQYNALHCIYPTKVAKRMHAQCSACIPLPNNTVRKTKIQSNLFVHVWIGGKYYNNPYESELCKTSFRLNTRNFGLSFFSRHVFLVFFILRTHQHVSWESFRRASWHFCNHKLGLKIVFFLYINSWLTLLINTFKLAIMVRHRLRKTIINLLIITFLVFTFPTRLENQLNTKSSTTGRLR